MNPALLSAAIDQSGDPILLTGADGTILYANSTLLRMTGYVSAELEDQPADHVLTVRTSDDVRRDMSQALSSGRVWRGELTVSRKDGAVFCCQATVTPVRDEAGAIVAFLSTFQDASARQELEARLRQSQKMEAVGRLAGGIAHDFNNVLTVIMGYSEQLAAGLEGQATLRAAAETIRAAAARAGGLTRQLLAFSRRQILMPRSLDVNAVVAEMNTLLRRLIGEDIQLVTRLTPECARVKADPSQLEQVVMNLAINARDAMPGGGTLTLETSIDEVGERLAATRAGLVPGRYVRLSVRDDGCGIDADTMAHLFEPFFTTKPEGMGTGLGLSTTYGIVKQSGGFVYADSEPKGGATFTVYLPYAAAPDEVTAAERACSQANHGSETLLVVEDEEAVRQLVCATLRQRGYQVLAASNAAAAISLVESYRGSLDLLVTDVVMPGMNGWDVARRVVETSPSTKVLFMSGHSQHPALERSASADAVPLLAKPFTAEQLAAAVRRAVDAAPPVLC